MTTYTAISATETQSGKPITESLMTRLANNLLAVVEQDPTAPILYPKVLPQDSGSVYAFSARSSGSSLGATSGASGYYDFFDLSVTSDFDADVRCDFQCKFIQNSGTRNVRLYVNGSLEAELGTWSYNVETEGYAWNITLSPGANTVTVAMDVIGPAVSGWAKIRGSWL